MTSVNSDKSSGAKNDLNSDETINAETMNSERTEMTENVNSSEKSTVADAVSNDKTITAMEIVIDDNNENSTTTEAINDSENSTAMEVVPNEEQTINSNESVITKEIINSDDENKVPNEKQCSDESNTEKQSVNNNGNEAVGKLASLGTNAGIESVGDDETEGASDDIMFESIVENVVADSSANCEKESKSEDVLPFQNVFVKLEENDAELSNEDDAALDGTFQDNVSLDYYEDAEEKESDEFIIGDSVTQSEILMVKDECDSPSELEIVDIKDEPTTDSEDFLITTDPMSSQGTETLSSELKGVPLKQFPGIARAVEHTDYEVLQALYQVLYLKRTWDTEKRLIKRILDFSGFNCSPDSEDYCTRKLKLCELEESILYRIKLLLSIPSQWLYHPHLMNSKHYAHSEEAKLETVENILTFLHKPIKGTQNRKAQAGTSQLRARGKKRPWSRVSANASPNSSTSCDFYSGDDNSDDSILDNDYHKPCGLSDSEILEIEKQLKDQIAKGNAAEVKVILKKLDQEAITKKLKSLSQPSSKLQPASEPLSVPSSSSARSLLLTNSSVKVKPRFRTRDSGLSVADTGHSLAKSILKTAGLDSVTPSSTPQIIRLSDNKHVLTMIEKNCTSKTTGLDPATSSNTPQIINLTDNKHDYVKRKVVTKSRTKMQKEKPIIVIRKDAFEIRTVTEGPPIEKQKEKPVIIVGKMVPKLHVPKLQMQTKELMDDEEVKKLKLEIEREEKAEEEERKKCSSVLQKLQPGLHADDPASTAADIGHSQDESMLTSQNNCALKTAGLDPATSSNNPQLIRLNDNKHVKFMALALEYEDLDILHNLIYLQDTGKRRIRQNILDFSGFDFDASSAKYKFRELVLERLGEKIVKRIAFIFGLAPSNTDLSIKDLTGLIMHFLMHPTKMDQIPMSEYPRRFFEEHPCIIRKDKILEGIPCDTLIDKPPPVLQCNVSAVKPTQKNSPKSTPRARKSFPSAGRRPSFNASSANGNNGSEDLNWIKTHPHVVKSVVPLPVEVILSGEDESEEEEVKEPSGIPYDTLMDKPRSVLRRNVSTAKPSQITPKSTPRARNSFRSVGRKPAFNVSSANSKNGSESLTQIKTHPYAVKSVVPFPVEVILSDENESEEEEVGHPSALPCDAFLDKPQSVLRHNVSAVKPTQTNPPKLTPRARKSFPSAGRRPSFNVSSTNSNNKSESLNQIKTHSHAMKSVVPLPVEVILSGEDESDEEEGGPPSPGFCADDPASSAVETGHSRAKSMPTLIQNKCALKTAGLDPIIISSTPQMSKLGDNNHDFVEVRTVTNSKNPAIDVEKEKPVIVLGKMVPKLRMSKSAMQPRVYQTKNGPRYGKQLMDDNEVKKLKLEIAREKRARRGSDFPYDMPYNAFMDKSQSVLRHKVMMIKDVNSTNKSIVHASNADVGNENTEQETAGQIVNKLFLDNSDKDISIAETFTSSPVNIPEKKKTLRFYMIKKENALFQQLQLKEKEQQVGQVKAVTAPSSAMSRNNSEQRANTPDGVSCESTVSQAKVSGPLAVTQSRVGGQLAMGQKIDSQPLIVPLKLTGHKAVVQTKVSGQSATAKDTINQPSVVQNKISGQSAVPQNKIIEQPVVAQNKVSEQSAALPMKISNKPDVTTPMKVSGQPKVAPQQMSQIFIPVSSKNLQSSQTSGPPIVTKSSSTGPVANAPVFILQPTTSNIPNSPIPAGPIGQSMQIPNLIRGNNVQGLQSGAGNQIIILKTTPNSLLVPMAQPNRNIPTNVQGIPTSSSPGIDQLKLLTSPVNSLFPILNTTPTITTTIANTTPKSTVPQTMLTFAPITPSATSLSSIRTVAVNSTPAIQTISAKHVQTTPPKSAPRAMKSFPSAGRKPAFHASHANNNKGSKDLSRIKSQPHAVKSVVPLPVEAVLSDEDESNEEKGRHPNEAEIFSAIRDIIQSSAMYEINLITITEKLTNMLPTLNMRSTLPFIQASIKNAIDDIVNSYAQKRRQTQR